MSPGEQLGPYKIEAPIGAGGMGQVFRALDTRLNRAVAVKVSHDQFSERFEREARAIAQLNHPHICTLHDVGPNYLVMELVEGDTLSSRLKKGPLPMDQVLRYGAQIADALAAAHAKGITHRDLKPGNIMITKAGVKVLDFGLARIEDDYTLTMAEAVMGTPAYMAPEQREGKKADSRADVYALGLVLREMATGKRAPQSLDHLPPQFTHLLHRCLEEDPENRWQSARDLKSELDWAAAAKPQVQAASASSARTAWIIASVACLGLIAGGIWISLGGSGADLGPSQFQISFDIEVLDFVPVPVPSPDGRSFVFVGKDPDGATSLRVRALESVEARRLPGTEGVEGAVIWSPDGAWIAFYAGRKLKKVSPAGGPPQTIADLPPPAFQDAAWSPSGDIIYRPQNRAPLYRIRDTGGSPQPLTTLNASLTENSHRFPRFLPDGRHFLFVGRCSDRVNNALYIGSLDSTEVHRVMPAQSRVDYLPPGSGHAGALLFYRDGALVAQPFDPASGKLSGNPASVYNGVAYNAPSILASFAASSDGRVIIAGSAGALDTRLTWFDRSGKEMGIVGPPGDYNQPRLSRDGARVAYTRPDPKTGNRDIWYTEIARGISSPLVNHVANDWFPVWSPDGQQLLFGSDREGGTIMLPFLKTSLDVGAKESRLALLDDQPHDWSRDGRWIAFGTNDIFVGAADGKQKPIPFLVAPTFETTPRFSPDGKWIAYYSNESGRPEVYARPFRGEPASSNGKIQLSNNGGEFPVWGPSGREIFYMSGDTTIFSVDTRNLGGFEPVPTPARLFRACPGTLPVGMPLRGTPYWFSYDTVDGNRFLVNCRVEPPGRFTVLMNWKFPQ